jgi:hypothetical protein
MKCRDCIWYRKNQSTFWKIFYWILGHKCTLLDSDFPYDNFFCYSFDSKFGDIYDNEG